MKKKDQAKMLQGSDIAKIDKGDNKPENEQNRYRAPDDLRQMISKRANSVQTLSKAFENQSSITMQGKKQEQKIPLKKQLQSGQEQNKQKKGIQLKMQEIWSQHKNKKAMIMNNQNESMYEAKNEIHRQISENERNVKISNRPNASNPEDSINADIIMLISQMCLPYNLILEITQMLL